MKRSELIEAIIGTLTVLDATRQVRSYEEKAKALMKIIDSQSDIVGNDELSNYIEEGSQIMILEPEGE